MPKLVVVCMANVCRSPMALSVLRQMARDQGLAKQLDASSAGVRVSWPGARIDPRAEAALRRRGYACAPSRSRQIVARDFEQPAAVLAMDHANLEELRALCPAEHAHKLRLFLDYAAGWQGRAVPDPYYGDARGFDNVLDLCEAGARGLLAALARDGTLS